MRREVILGAALLLAAADAAAQSSADPRVGLRAGWKDAGVAARGMELVSHTDRPQGLFDPAEPGAFGFMNSDLAFRGDLVIQGNFSGFQVFDVSDPRAPRLRAVFVCPGGQGDVSVYGDLLFVSVEETRGRVDCGPQGVRDTVSAERFRGVRIFDIGNVEQPRQIAAVQTCRGSHTHTLLKDPDDDANLYVYVQGTGQVRPAAELAGCSGLGPSQDPNTSYFRIEVIRVPLAAPQNARVVSEPRVFADPATGNPAGLWPGGRHGPGTQQTSQTTACHDITVYPELGLAAGACSGNGILLDIRDPVNPVRIDEVVDPNFAYWHSATFSNDGSSVVFTDEWGGGTSPRCRATDRPEWGANAIFRLRDGELRHASYFKIPAPQTAEENCVAHNGSLVPVPGRDIKVQGWYQGGVSVFDFTDPANPVEIAFFDRGPMSAQSMQMGGFWAAYWYNGLVYGGEIGRGLDIFRLTPGPWLTENEIEAASLVRTEQFNPQHQERITWPAHFAVARAYKDQIVRGGGLSPDRTVRLEQMLARAEALPPGARQDRALADLAAWLASEAPSARDGERVRALADVLRRIAAD